MDMLKEIDVFGGKIVKIFFEEGYKVLREGEVEEK